MKKEDTNWIKKPLVNKILLAFCTPKTPSQAEKETGIKKLKLKPYLEKQLIKCLNPEAKKGRLHIITNKAKDQLEKSKLKKK